MFIRRFHPDQVIRLPSVATPPKGEEFKRACKEPARHGIQLKGNHSQTWKRLGWRPPGVVVTRVDDPAWPAAIALATDRGQLAFLDADFGSPMEPSILINGSFLRRAFNRRKQTGYAMKALAMTMSLLSGSWQLSINIPKMLRIPVTDDGLARHPDGQRWQLSAGFTVHP